MTLTAWICPDLMDTRSTWAPACSTAARGSVYSTSSTPSVARKATRRPSSCRAMVNSLLVASVWAVSLDSSPPGSAANTHCWHELPCVKQVTTDRYGVPSGRTIRKVRWIPREPERPAGRHTRYETPGRVDRRAARRPGTGGLFRGTRFAGRLPRGEFPASGRVDAQHAGHRSGGRGLPAGCAHRDGDADRGGPRID